MNLEMNYRKIYPFPCIFPCISELVYHIPLVLAHIVQAFFTKLQNKITKGILYAYFYIY